MSNLPPHRDLGLGYALKQAQHALRRRMEEELRGVGLTMPQHVVLSVLAEEPDISNADLARSAFVTPQSMQGILSIMERQKMIERRPDATHGRRQLTRLTAHGRELLEKARSVDSRMNALLGVAVHPLDPGEMVAALLRCRDIAAARK